MILKATSFSIPSLTPSKTQVARPDQEKLTSDQQAEAQEMKARDREVRAHEQAHMAAGGQYVTQGATYSYEQGPDGQRYATGGEVGIDTSPESGDPEATIRKMQMVRAAALAPASPSGQDLQVASQADQAASKARSELQDKKVEEGEKAANLTEKLGAALDFRA